jgi:YfiH family protein
MIKQGTGFYTFKIFSLYPSLVAVISTKASGNFLPLKQGDVRSAVSLEDVGIDRSRIVLAEQNHGANVAWVTSSNVGQVMKSFDGMATSEKNLFPMILVADCVPILFYDPVQNFVACAHSGWQGALQKVGFKVVEELTKFGSSKENILVALGPAIGSCHYSVPESRASLFDLNFGKGSVTKRRRGVAYVDIVEATKKPLLDFGIPDKNIETAAVCTVENNDFFSYRKDGESAGRFAAIIGMKG